MLSVARSRFTLPAQAVFLVTNALSLLMSIAYTRSTPDLYKNNSHHKIGWAVSGIAAAWVFMAFIEAWTRPSDADRDGMVLRQMRTTAIPDYQHSERWRDIDVSRWSGDSGQGTERNSDSLCGHSDSDRISSGRNCSPASPSRQHRDAFEEVEFEADEEKTSFLGGSVRNKYLSWRPTSLAFHRWIKIWLVLYSLIDRTILVLGFLALTTGGVVYGGVFVS
jgi:hypothetical protein